MSELLLREPLDGGCQRGVRRSQRRAKQVTDQHKCILGSPEDRPDTKQALVFRHILWCRAPEREGARHERRSGFAARYRKERGEIDLDAVR